MIKKETGYKAYFGKETALLISKKIKSEYVKFNSDKFLSIIVPKVYQLELIDRNILISKALQETLPQEYKKALEILVNILGPENEDETGMFTKGYWIWPIAKFVEIYGTNDFSSSIKAIYEITKRHTGEFAIRPYINLYPNDSIKIMYKWSLDKNVHVRRLSSEGLRPKLPWAKKLTLFIDNPKPVFNIINNLKEDNSMFVKKSVGNLLNDYSKENKKAMIDLIEKWKKTENKNTQWIIKHALRSINRRNKI